jgi:hypothetical protein
LPIHGNATLHDQLLGLATGCYAGLGNDLLKSFLHGRNLNLRSLRSPALNLLDLATAHHATNKSRLKAAGLKTGGPRLPAPLVVG